MVRPDLDQCPKCKTHRLDLKQRARTREMPDGELVISGFFWSCECGALTRSCSTGVLNLRDEVAAEYGVEKVKPKPAAIAVAPFVRRAGVRLA